MRFNISQLQNFVMCPQYMVNHDILRWGLAGESPSLTLGTMFHKAMEAKLRGEEIPPVVALLGACENPAPGAAEDWAKHDLTAVLMNWDIPDAREPRFIEKELEAPLGAHTLVGRLDAIDWLDGYWWSEQHKTYTSDLSALIDKVRLSWHECAYQYLMEKNGYTPTAGTILNACQKLPGYQMIPDPETGKKHRRTVELPDRVAAFSTHYVTRTPEDLGVQLANIEYYANLMEEMALGFPIRQTGSCFSHARRCQYYTTCWQGAKLESAPFVQLKERYATKTTAE
jgi:hypothetical protein